MSEVIYPEDSVDVSLLSHNGERGELMQGMKAIERGKIAVLFKHSTDYEALLTAKGKLALVHLLGWTLGGSQVALATLWERFPELRPYLRSRTEHYVAATRRESQLLGDATEPALLAELERDLQLLPSDT